MIGYQNILKEIKTTKWWVEEAPASFLLFDYIMKAFVHAEKITGYPTLKKIIHICKNNIGFEITPYDEKKDNFDKIYQNELKKPGYFQKLVALWLVLQKELLELNGEVTSEVDNFGKRKLLLLTKKFFNLGFECITYGTFIECIDPFTESLPDIFKNKYQIKDKNLQKTISTLSVQKERSFLTQEKLDFLYLCLGTITAEEYTKKWYWIKTNYREAIDIDPRDLQDKAKQELRKVGRTGIEKIIEKTLSNEKKLVKDKASLLKKLKLKREDRILFKLLEQFAKYIDLRKESMLRHTYARDKFLQKLARKVPYRLIDLHSMRDEEILAIIRGKKINLKKIRNRHKISVMYYTPKSETELQGKEAEKIYETFIKTLDKEQIKGVVASAPVKKIIGKISVVMDVNRDEFTPGTILVTSMTRPEFMPLVRKARAVITDEGGLTCHAAIISRELKIPCIIGTKNATKILRNGNNVEMDLEGGVIKIIK